MRTASFLVVIALAGRVASVGADDDLVRQTTLSGFGALAYVHNSLDEAAFLRNIGQNGKVGRHHSLLTDTLLGLQINHCLNPDLELVGQVILEDQVEPSLDNAVTRAFVGYRPTPDLRLRLGRLGDATYLMSDYHEVAYAYPWVRAPETTYSLLPFRAYDGADFTYTHNTEDTTWRVKGYAGLLSRKIPYSGGDEPFHLASDGPALGVALIREKGPWKLWLGHSTFRIAHGFPRADEGIDYLKAFAAIPMNPHREQALDLLEGIDIKGKRLGYSSIGVAYDDGDWMLQAELSRLFVQDGGFSSGQHAYISLGPHYGDFLPYILVGTARAPKAARSIADWGPYNDLQTGVVEAINMARLEEDMVAVGLRWDLHSQAALKLQWSRFFIHENGWVLWTTTPGNRRTSDTADVFSLSLNFTF